MSPIGRRARPSVIVIGAGIVGAATAYFLSLAGAKVTLIEAENPSAGATGASDGAVSVASKRPGVMMELARKARDLYGHLVQDGPLAGLFHTRPTYLYACTAPEIELIENQQHDLASVGEPTLWLTREELLKRVPALGSPVSAGLKVPLDGHAIGYQVTDRLLACAGVIPQRHVPVIGLALHGSRVIGVRTQQGVITADRVVISAGMGSAALMDLGDVLIARRGQLIITDRARTSGQALPGSLMSAGYLASKRVGAQAHSVALVIDPLMTGQFLIGSSREAGITDRQTDARTVSAILHDALEIYPALARQRVIRTFAGIRATTADALPIVGRHPTIEGLIIATGMQGDGICLGPILGAQVARLACDAEPLEGIGALSPSRFTTR